MFEIGFFAIFAKIKNFTSCSIVTHNSLLLSYFGTPMIPYWRHLYENVETLVAKTNYADIKQVKINANNYSGTCV